MSKSQAAWTGWKAVSVTEAGQPDGFEPPCFYRPELLQGGYTRISVSVPPDQLEKVHRGLLRCLSAPLKFMYQQMIDRPRGIQLPRPLSFVAVELPLFRVEAALNDAAQLVYRDGRHQVWIRGFANEQLVLEETGMIHIYPDDPSFREALEKLGVPPGDAQTMAERDYVRVNLHASCDREEAQLMADLHLVRWEG